ncbi:hypothetical protein K7X08_028996 [Anisodus acutangulus]|uniref:Uncharacterized protein n=1 Tax=Anisodus acutangulus TaxID=402998 RepID=A0A9Q1QTQ8_9SOLA|nr:hypothetical protein K7X08_028996 [Anisodus acutangulus]
MRKPDLALSGLYFKLSAMDTGDEVEVFKTDSGTVSCFSACSSLPWFPSISRFIEISTSCACKSSGTAFGSSYFGGFLSGLNSESKILHSISLWLCSLHSK